MNEGISASSAGKARFSLRHLAQGSRFRQLILNKDNKDFTRLVMQIGVHLNSSSGAICVKA